MFSCGETEMFHRVSIIALLMNYNGGGIKKVTAGNDYVKLLRGTYVYLEIEEVVKDQI